MAKNEAGRFLTALRSWIGVVCGFVVLLACAGVAAQQGTGTQANRPAQAEPRKDALGRDTPRGTLLGFMSASRQGNDSITPLYLNTNLRDQAAVDLAHQLYLVLDRRLPARLDQLSDRPEGSLANPLKPDQDIVGTITTSAGPVEILVERVTRGGSEPVWLFSRKTLDSIPEIYDEVALVSVDRFLPDLLAKTRIAGIRLFEWLVFFLIIPLIYRLVGLLDVLLARAIAFVRRRRGAGRAVNPLPGPVRLLLLALAIRWLLGSLELPLLERRFWSVTASMLGIVAVVWLLILLNGKAEGYLQRRLLGSQAGEKTAILGLARRVADTLVIIAGGLVTLRRFGIDPTAALAGLGIGGIAVALAAQKTLENVIGGLSIIFDQAVRVGDSLRLGDIEGTVADIGLRSTRIRTLDRTIISMPNGQIASANVETLSARDKFWFHHFVGLRYETTSVQMRSVIDGIRNLIVAHSDVDVDSVRVRFFRLGASSLDVEVFAYVFASNWNRFLEIQQELLLRIMEIVEASGTEIAFPSQTLHLVEPRSPVSVARSDTSVTPTPVGARPDRVASV